MKKINMNPSENGLKRTLLIAFMSCCLYVNGQEIAVKKIDQQATTTSSKVLKSKQIQKTQKSNVSGRVIYFVNDKIINNKRLKLIPKDSIQSVNIIKRDTTIHDELFNTQIFVTLITKKEN